MVIASSSNSQMSSVRIEKAPSSPVSHLLLAQSAFSQEDGHEQSLYYFRLSLAIIKSLAKHSRQSSLINTAQQTEVFLMANFLSFDRLNSMAFSSLWYCPTPFSIVTVISPPINWFCLVWINTRREDLLQICSGVPIDSFEFLRQIRFNFFLLKSSPLNRFAKVTRCFLGVEGSLSNSIRLEQRSSQSSQSSSSSTMGFCSTFFFVKPVPDCLAGQLLLLLLLTRFLISLAGTIKLWIVLDFSSSSPQSMYFLPIIPPPLFSPLTSFSIFSSMTLMSSPFQISSLRISVILFSMLLMVFFWFLSYFYFQSSVFFKVNRVLFKSSVIDLFSETPYLILFNSAARQLFSALSYSLSFFSKVFSIQRVSCCQSGTTIFLGQSMPPLLLAPTGPMMEEVSLLLAVRKFPPKLLPLEKVSNLIIDLEPLRLASSRKISLYYCAERDFLSIRSNLSS